MKTSKRYKITSPALIAAGRAHKAALSRWYRLGATHGDPHWKTPYLERDRNRTMDLVLYAVALGRKRGELPDDMRDWDAALISHDMPEGEARVRFMADGMRDPIYVFLRHLDWVPGPVIEETEEEAPALMAA